MTQAVVWNGSRAELLARLRSLSGVLSGRLPDPGGVRAASGVRLANGLLRAAREDFLQKEEGGRGHDGIRWVQLKPRTIARRIRCGTWNGKILNEYGDLLLSLTPGHGGSLSGSAGQSVDYDLPGGVLVRLTEKPWHHAGGGRLPARPLWPSRGELPRAWWQDILGELSAGMPDILATLLAGRR